MFFKQKTTLPIVLLSALLSIVLSYSFGNDGYEAFVVACIGLGILMLRQSVELVRMKQRWLFVQILLGLMLMIVGLSVVFILIFALSPELTNPKITVPPITWWVVALSSLPFLFRPITPARHNNLAQVTTHLVTIIYSSIVFYAAAITYYKAESSMVGLILVLAVQLQYVMAYIVMNTSYIPVVNGFFAHGSFYKTDLGRHIHMLVVGLPFFVPLLVIMLVGAIK